ncbi:hypothetical protein [Fervidibacillus albus]|uniref:Uncharacterized protein n=1 Tax=Fervidibacillus albus TaxID=2980026 RepID=A0A9E8LTW0_9BACI|nr:hypothetical protein [Fervidibacillus albus]WAA09514.1 hypothetical protein OE104_13440 [Fervidibacillus albus]
MKQFIKHEWKGKSTTKGSRIKMKKTILFFLLMIGGLFLFSPSSFAEENKETEERLQCTMTIISDKHSFFEPAIPDGVCNGYVDGYFIADEFGRKQFHIIGIITYEVTYSGQQFEFSIPLYDKRIVLTVYTILNEESKENTEKETSEESKENTEKETSEENKENTEKETSEENKENTEKETSEESKENTEKETSEESKENTEKKTNEESEDEAEKKTNDEGKEDTEKETNEESKIETKKTNEESKTGSEVSVTNTNNNSTTEESKNSTEKNDNSTNEIMEKDGSESDSGLTNIGTSSTTDTNEQSQTDNKNEIVSEEVQSESTVEGDKQKHSMEFLWIIVVLSFVLIGVIFMVWRKRTSTTATKQK